MHHLGLSHSPFQQHRQFSSPSASPGTGHFSFPSSAVGSPTSVLGFGNRNFGGMRDGLDDEDEEEEGDGESVEALIRRLKGLVGKLEGGGEVKGRALKGILERVQGVERMVEDERGLRRLRERGRVRLDQIGEWERESYLEDGEGSGVGEGRMDRLDSDSGMGEEEEMDNTIRGKGTAVGIAQKEEVEMSPSKAAEIAQAAEELAESLSATVAELISRKEESDHIHDLLVVRAEQATERILFLEYRIAEMEDDSSANQSELKFLRIQLQALETQCSPFLPQHVDHELSQSIMNWKIDWEDINRRSRARRKMVGGLSVPGERRGTSEEVRLRRSFVEVGE